jgi:hypothetical protein
MSIMDQRFRYCMDCAYAVWPQYELGYCAHPDASQSITSECRAANGACGLSAKLYVEKKDEDN